MIGYSVAVDGGGVDTVISEALGSRRFVVTFRGPGGLSWSDFGVPNPVVAMARAIDLFSGTSVPVSPKTTYNVGVVEGGTSVNSIPESATMKVDIRSSSPAEIDRVERALHSAAQQALDQANTGHERRLLEAKIEAIGDRPAAEVDPNARILQVIRAVDALLGISSRIQRASTDSNVPISMGRQAMTLGGGGSGGGAHTMQEWYDTANRELGLRRILLAVVTLAGVPE
jgi:di/tripeptidase